MHLKGRRRKGNMGMQKEVKSSTVGWSVFVEGLCPYESCQQRVASGWARMQKRLIV